METVSLVHLPHPFAGRADMKAHSKSTEFTWCKTSILGSEGECGVKWAIYVGYWHRSVLVNPCLR